MDRDGNKIVQLNDDTKVGLRAGTWALREIQKKLNCKGILEVLAHYAPTDGNLNTDVAIITIVETANDYTHHQKKGTIIEERQAATIIDKMGGPVAAFQIINELFTHFLPKNLTPPQKEGELISA